MLQPFRFVFLLFILCFGLFAQNPGAISGTVLSSEGRPIRRALIRIVSEPAGVERALESGPDGGFHVEGLAPGRYFIEYEAAGFRAERMGPVLVMARDRHTLVLELMPKTSSATPTATLLDPQPVSASLTPTTTLDSRELLYLPTPLRSAPAYTSLAPGIVGVADSNASGSAFSANGLRPRMNDFTLDGVRFYRGGPWETSLTGGFLLSPDLVQQMSVQTAAIDPEFGLAPGAQIALVTRQGGSAFHGSVFGYASDERFHANDWFANAGGLGRAPASYHNAGATLGGPLAADRTFFFLSFERLRTNFPFAMSQAVPSLLSRSEAPTELQPFLNAFPLPDRWASDENATTFTGFARNETNLNPFSARVDHAFSDTLRLFARYGYSPWRQQSARGFVNALESAEYDTHSATTGLLWNTSPETSNDLRINYFRQGAESTHSLGAQGGAAPLLPASFFPDGFDAASTRFTLNAFGLGSFSIGKGADYTRNSVNVVDNLTRVSGNHTLKLGFDYLRAFSTIRQPVYSVDVTFGGPGTGENQLLSGTAANAVVASYRPLIEPVQTSVSLYGQDTWRVSPRSTLLFGLRWNINPAPNVRSGSPPFTLAGDSLGINRFGSYYETRWTDIAPRAGFVYQMDTTPGREMVFRAGIGLFYDTGFVSPELAFQGAPFSAQRVLALPVFPLTSAALSPPQLPAERPYGLVSVAEPTLLTPRVWQWNLGIERAMGPSQSLSLSYTGNSGQNLLRSESRPLFSTDYDLYRILTNGASSEYHGFQAQFQRRLRDGFHIQTAYTWGRAFDNASSTLPAGTGLATIVDEARANSDFDVRQQLRIAASYLLPGPRDGIHGAVLRDWWLDGFFTARTGLPLDVSTLTAVTSDTNNTTAEDEPGLYALVRPDYLGLPVWLDDPLAPGGRRLNPAAFSLPEEFVQGTLPRNGIRGFGLAQLDLALRREIGLRENLRFQVQFQALNILNHPNFANPSAARSAYLASPAFGAADSTLGLSGGNAISGSGGARTLQLGLRLEF